MYEESRGVSNIITYSNMGLIKTPKMGLTNEEKYILVLQWMYVSESKCNSGEEWRRELVKFIGRILEIDVDKMQGKLEGKKDS